jgi:hypothetical protein
MVYRSTCFDCETRCGLHRPGPAGAISMVSARRTLYYVYICVGSPTRDWPAGEAEPQLQSWTTHRQFAQWIHPRHPRGELQTGRRRFNFRTSAQRALRPAICSQPVRAAESLQSAACGSPPRRAYRPYRRRGRVAEGGGLLNRYRVVKLYRGFESLRLRHFPIFKAFRLFPASKTTAVGGSGR